MEGNLFVATDIETALSEQAPTVGWAHGFRR